MKRATLVLATTILAAALYGVTATSALASDIPGLGPAGFTPPAIKIAVVYSKSTIDWLNRRGTPSRYPHGGKEKALVYYLQKRGYNVTEIVGDRDLVNGALLDQYDVVVLNSMYAMDYPASESLARYVYRGGGLVATIGSPRVNQRYAPRRGASKHLNEWWWRVMKEKGVLHYWEWGPLSSLYSEAFVNDGPYDPEWTLVPNPNSPIIKQTQAILSARSLNSNISGITLHHPHANIEMSLRLAGTESTSAADFNIKTRWIKKLYPKTYKAILGTAYGSGRAVKFDYGATDFLQNYSSTLYNPYTPTGVRQGEVGGALVEGAIIWASSVNDSSTVRSAGGATQATVSARGGRITAKQRVTNLGKAMTRTTVKLSIYSPSGKLVKRWTKTKVRLFPGQSKTYTFKYKRALPRGTCKVVASLRYGYPGTSQSAVSTSTITRGQTVRTH
jgi:hypothetical protein